MDLKLNTTSIGALYLHIYCGVQPYFIIPPIHKGQLYKGRIRRKKYDRMGYDNTIFMVLQGLRSQTMSEFKRRFKHGYNVTLKQINSMLIPFKVQDDNCLTTYLMMSVSPVRLVVLSIVDGRWLISTSLYLWPALRQHYDFIYGSKLSIWQHMHTQDSAVM